MRTLITAAIAASLAGAAGAELQVFLNDGDLGGWIGDYSNSKGFKSFLDITADATANASNQTEPFTPPFDEHADVPWAVSTYSTYSVTNHPSTEGHRLYGSAETPAVRFLTETTDRTVGAASRRFARALSVGDVVDAGSGPYLDRAQTYYEYADSPVDPVESYSLGELYFTGLQFQMAGETHYGWILWDGARNPTPFAWAYETEAGVGARVINIPAPGAAMLFGLAAAATRRRR